MNRKSFWIPVGWLDPERRTKDEDKVLSLNSNTLVLHVGKDRLLPPFDVERIAGSWSPHVPEKKPKYKVSWDQGSSWCAQDILVEPRRLQNIPVGQDILVVLPTHHPQRCLRYQEELHGIYYNRHGNAPYTYCGLSPSHPNPDWFVPRDQPTCKACLQYKSVWCMFTIWPYDHKEAILRREKKEQTAEEKRLRLPTAYARILDDDLFENPTYKPPRVRAPLLVPEPEPEDEFENPRDRKRAAEIDRNRRLEESKARMDPRAPSLGPSRGLQRTREVVERVGDLEALVLDGDDLDRRALLIEVVLVVDRVRPHPLLRRQFQDEAGGELVEHLLEHALLSRGQLPSRHREQRAEDLQVSLLRLGHVGVYTVIFSSDEKTPRTCFSRSTLHYSPWCKGFQ